MAASFLVQSIERMGHSHAFPDLPDDHGDHHHGDPTSNDVAKCKKDAKQHSETVNNNSDDVISVDEETCTCSEDNQLSGKSSVISHVSIFVLELGILIHSLIIGLTLGSTPTNSSSYTTLLIAVCFHQFFEGLALGVLVSDTTLSFAYKLMLGFIYPITTPVGIAIGMHLSSNSFMSPSSSLLMQGILNSLSSGILMVLFFKCYIDTGYSTIVM